MVSSRTAASSSLESPALWGNFSFISSAFLKQVDTVTDNVSGYGLVGSTWVPVDLTTASKFATGLSQSPLFQRKGERGEGRLKGEDYGLFHIPLPVPVTLNTSCLPPSPANFPDSRHYHWAKPRELFETLPCTHPHASGTGLGRFLPTVRAPTPHRGSPAKQCRYLHFKASLGSQEAGTEHAGKHRLPLAKAGLSSSRSAGRSRTLPG